MNSGGTGDVLVVAQEFVPDPMRRRFRCHQKWLCFFCREKLDFFNGFIARYRPGFYHKDRHSTGVPREMTTRIVGGRRRIETKRFLGKGKETGTTVDLISRRDLLSILPFSCGHMFEYSDWGSGFAVFLHDKDRKKFWGMCVLQAVKDASQQSVGTIGNNSSSFR